MLRPEIPSNNEEEPKGAERIAPKEKPLSHEKFRPLFYFAHHLDSLFFIAPDLQEILEKEKSQEVTSVVSAPAEQLSRSAERTDYFVEGKGLVKTLLELANSKGSKEDFLGLRKQLERFFSVWAGKERKPVMVFRNKRPAWGALKTPLPAESILQEFDAVLEEVFGK